MSELVKGFYPKSKHPNAPDFVVGKLSINLEQFTEWLKGYLTDNPNEQWLTLDMKISKENKGYAVIDDWKPEKSSPPEPVRNLAGDEIPF